MSYIKQNNENMFQKTECLKTCSKQRQDIPNPQLSHSRHLNINPNYGEIIITQDIGQLLYLKKYMYICRQNCMNFVVLSGVS
jgi:hypothetical protein